MECNQSLLPPSSPPTIETEGDLGSFLDGILFSPEGNLLADGELLGSNPIHGVANDTFSVSQPIAHAQPSKLASSPAGNAARKPSKALHVEPSEGNSPSLAHRPIEAPVSNTENKSEPSTDQTSNAAKSQTKLRKSSKPSQEKSPFFAQQPVEASISNPINESGPIIDETSEAPRSQTNLKQNSDAGSNDKNSEPALVSPTEKDILSVRGNYPAPANIMYRELISSNKAHFDTLTTEEQEAFSKNLWLELREKGHRFLRPKSWGYEILNHDLSVKKIHQALRENRTNKVSKPPPKKRQKAGKFSKPAEPLLFDHAAKSEILKLLGRRELVNAMEEAWGNDLEEKRHLFEKQLLERYRAAASQRGMPAKEFSDRLLPILLKGVGVNSEDSKQENQDEPKIAAP